MQVPNSKPSPQLNSESQYDELDPFISFTTNFPVVQPCYRGIPIQK